MPRKKLPKGEKIVRIDLFVKEKQRAAAKIAVAKLEKQFKALACILAFLFLSLTSHAQPRDTLRLDSSRTTLRELQDTRSFRAYIRQTYNINWYESVKPGELLDLYEAWLKQRPFTSRTK